MGLVRSGDFRKGTPITLPHTFGTPVTLPEPQGNVNPQANSSLSSNPVTWAPSPAHFGNTVDLSLQTVAPIVIVAPGGTGTTNINLTQLLDTPTPTLTYSGAPAGVTLAFAPNPNTGTSVCTITVSAAVPAGKYAITITGTSGTEVNTTVLHLVIGMGGSPSPPPSGATFIASIEAVGSSYATPNNSITGAGGGASSINTTGASIIVAIIRANNAIPSMSDSESNTWSYGTVYTTSGSLCNIVVASVVNPTTSSIHTFNPGGSEASAEIFAFSGGSGWTLDTEAGSSTNTSGTSVVTGSITPSGSGEIIVAGIGSNGSESTGTVNNGFTGGQGVSSGDMLPQKLSTSPEIGGGAYLIDSSSSSIDAVFSTGTSNGDWVWIIAAFTQ